MGWAKFDDRRHTNGKLIAAGLAANGLDANGITYCAANETDGFIPDDVLPILAPGLSKQKRTDLSTALVTNARWTRDVDRKGHWIHDFLKFHPSHADLEKKRADDVERKRKQRRTDEGRFQTESAGNPNGVHSESNGSHTDPIPSHPIPSSDVSNPSSDLRLLGADEEPMDDLEVERLTRQWRAVLVANGRNPNDDAVRASIRECLRMADPRVVSERIGWLHETAAPRSAGYLVTTVRNYLRDHGQQVPA